jgi:GR25 family glycosyltransferase involved in LPS biosynthesis
MEMKNFFKLDTQPPAYCIFLDKNEYSCTKLNQVIHSGKKYGWTVEGIPGVEGDKINWKAENILPSLERKFQRRKGAQGCFMSHYNLWKHCLKINSPIIILEHDIIFIDQWKPITLTHDVLKLFKKTKLISNEFTGEWQVGAHAYIITPNGAKKLINWVENNFAFHADILIGSLIINWSNLDIDIVTIDSDNVSTTRFKAF